MSLSTSLTNYLAENFKKIFVINLDRRPDRYEKFLTRLPFSSDLIERISAVDGQTLKTEFPERKKKYNELGCFFSHKNILEKIVNDESFVEEDYFMIFEDDVEFHSNFEKDFEHIFEKVKKTKEITFFGQQYKLDICLLFFGGRFTKHFIPDNLLRYWIKINKDYRYTNLYVRRFQTINTNKHCFDRTTHFIILKKKTAQLLLEQMKLIDFHQNHHFTPPIDVFYQNIQSSIPELHFIECFPHFCYSSNTKDSDIQFEK